MKASELRAKNLSELEDELINQLSAQFKQNLKYTSGQLSQVHLIKKQRREIARIKTVLNEKKVGK